MGRHKQHRHDHDHEQRADRPQSTDIADVIEHDESAQAVSAHQRRAPTAGPSEDDRFGEGATARDAEGRIIGVSVVGGMTRIMIGLGKNQGVGVGMEGYVKSDDGMLADFQIEEVRERTSFAMVDVTVDMITSLARGVVINPSSMPEKSQPVKDTEARIVGVSIEGGRTKIMIGRGARHGARWGMPGYVIGKSGRSIADFTVVEQHSTHCSAFVDLTIDQIQQSERKVMLNPTSMPGGGPAHDDDASVRGRDAATGS
jgi:hypothetical protein